MSVPFLARLSIAVFALSVSSTALMAQQPQTTASAQPPATQEPPAPAGPLACPFCDFSHADLSGKNFTNANLQGANFSGANASNAVFNGAELSGANFTNANLTNASFNTTSIGDADLSTANLTNANLQGASMNGTDLQFAITSGTNLGGVDLSSANIGAVLRVGTTDGRRTNLRGARLRRDVQIDAAHADTTDLVRVDPPATAPPANAAAAGYPWACGGADLSHLTSVVYVGPKGIDGKDCGKSESESSRCATIAAGISRCAVSGCGVLVYWAEYYPAATIEMRDGVSVYGGCLPPNSSSQDLRSQVYAPVGGTPVLKASSIYRPTIIQNLALHGSAAQGTTAAPSITVTLRDSFDLSFVNSALYGNVGAKGGAGSAASIGAKGGNGGDGGDGGSVYRNGAGGTSPCGGTGGTGGGVMYALFYSKNSCTPSCPPLVGASTCGGAQGQIASSSKSPPAFGGGPGMWNCSSCLKSKEATGGDGNGFRGWPAKCGAGFRLSPEPGGSKGYINGDGVWVASSNNNGQPGTDGNGGGGGGAGGWSCPKKPRIGNQGGGGGGGGCAGSAGKSGQQGGASFTILASTSYASEMLPSLPVWFKGCHIVGGRGGDGGKGSDGALGGVGGAGGAGGTYPYEDGGGSGAGGEGETGGQGGGGGGGDGGPSVLFVTHRWPLWSGSGWQVNTSTSLGASGSPGTGGSGSNPTGSCIGVSSGGWRGDTGMVAVSTSF